MGVSRALGALLCVVCVVIAVVHIYFGYIEGPRIHLAFGLPVTVGVLVIAGLGFWLGWIMATTKEVAPAAPVPEKAKKPEAAEE